MTDFCDGKVQAGCDLFHNLQAWQPRESGKQLDRCISLLSCVWFTVTEPHKNQFPTQGWKFIGWRHWPSELREISSSRKEKSVIRMVIHTLIIHTDSSAWHMTQRFTFTFNIFIHSHLSNTCVLSQLTLKVNPYGRDKRSWVSLVTPPGAHTC